MDSLKRTIVAHLESFGKRRDSVDPSLSVRNHKPQSGDLCVLQKPRTLACWVSAAKVRASVGKCVLSQAA